MRALNSKEAVILISNLSSDEAFIPQHEIITDVTQMRTVANVHESLVSRVSVCSIKNRLPWTTCHKRLVYKYVNFNANLRFIIGTTHNFLFCWVDTSTWLKVFVH